MEAFAVPLELLVELTPSDFPNAREYQRWRKRQLMALEEGLLHHPARAWQATQGGGDREAERTASAERKLRSVLGDVRDGRLDLQGASGKKALRDAVVGLAERPIAPGAKGSDLHWADGYPFSIRMYSVLLGAGFYGPRDGSMVAELEDVLEVLFKVWPVLGITPLAHRTVFGWLFARQYFACGEKSPGLLVAADHQVRGFSSPPAPLHRACSVCLSPAEDTTASQEKGGTELLRAELHRYTQCRMGAGSGVLPVGKWQAHHAHFPDPMARVTVDRVRRSDQEEVLVDEWLGGQRRQCGRGGCPAVYGGKVWPSHL